VRLDAPKQHASSFPHLPDIYHQAVPVLLALTAAWPTPPAQTADIPPAYRAEHRDLAPERLALMTTELGRLAPLPDGYDKPPWSQTVAMAWHSVEKGASAQDAAMRLWPQYARQVRRWLCDGSRRSPHERAAHLSEAHERLLSAVRANQEPPP
ncbi:MAG: glucosylglycerate synthase, partial [Actinomycetota bacterium]|nr:glucosylglycerate synthase [Actinomycetota bacterium]